MIETNPSDEGKPQRADTLPKPHFELHVEMPRTKSRILPLLWLLVGVACMLVWLLSVHGAIGKLEKRLTAQSIGPDAGPKAEQQQQIRSFETRLARVLGASVESKLRTLEKSVERGALSTEELRLLESAASELRLLQSNPAALAAVGAAVDTPEHPRFQALAGSRPENRTGELVHDIAELRNFYYASLIGFALFGLMAAGLWFSARRRYRLIEAPARHQLPVIKSYHEDRGR